MSSLSAVQSAIDLIDWNVAGLSRVKAKLDELITNMDNDLNEAEYDESSMVEKIYSELKKLVDEEELLAAEELPVEDDEDEAEDDIEFEDDEDEDEEDEAVDVPDVIKPNID